MAAEPLQDNSNIAVHHPPEFPYTPYQVPIVADITCYDGSDNCRCSAGGWVGGGSRIIFIF